MSNILKGKLINGVMCYSPDVADSYIDYPESGFELTDSNSNSSFWVDSRNRLFKWIVKRFMVKNGKTKLLEIGCGTGDFIAQIIGNSKLDITGSEVYIKGLLYAKKNLPSANFIQFDVTEGIIDQRFDIITAFDVIEHVEDDNAALSNMKLMLNDRGVLIISVPQHKFLWSKLDEIVRHKRRYTKAELLKKLNDAGYTVDLITSFVFTLFPLMFVSRLLDKQRDKAKSADNDMEKRVKFSRLSNYAFDLFMRIDEFFIKLGVSLPFGGTLIVVAKAR